MDMDMDELRADGTAGLPEVNFDIDDDDHDLSIMEKSLIDRATSLMSASTHVTLARWNVDNGSGVGGPDDADADGARFRINIETERSTPTMTSDAAVRAAVLLGVANSARRLPSSTSSRRLRLYMLYHTKSTRLLSSTLLFILLGLILVEPSWPFALTAVIECLCLFFFCIESVVRYYVFGTVTTKEKAWFALRVISIVVSFVDVFANIILVASGMAVWRVAPFVRPMFLLEKKKLRGLAENVMKSISGLFDVVILQLFIVLVFSVVGIVLFKDTEQERVYFRSLPATFVHLFVLMTTANFPDVMMPAYRENAAYSIYFILYLIITLFIFFKLVLATIYNTYKRHLETHVRNEFLNERVALNLAFKTLDHSNTGAVGFDVFVSVVRMMRPMGLDKVRLMFNMLDVTNTNTLSWPEFKNFCAVFNLRIQRTEYNLVALRNWKTLGKRALLKKIVSHRAFDASINLLIFAAALLTVIEASEVPVYQIRRDEGGISVFSLVLALVFVMEAILKIIAYSWIRYIRSAWNRFDLVITVLSVVLEGLAMAADSDSATPMVFAPLVLVLRVFRLLRLVSVFSRFRVIIGTFSQLIPGLVAYAGLLLVLYYIFAVLGTRLFGSPNVLTPANLAGCNCDYVTRDFFANNFESFPVAMVTLFELMVVNQWWVTMEGTVYATKSGWTYLFFMGWYILVVLVLNLVIAFVLEAYLRVWRGAPRRDAMVANLTNRLKLAAARMDGEAHAETRWEVQFPATTKEVSRQMFGIS